MKIRILTDIEIGEIAAGEVVLDVFSVLKELIENSIDANSTQIIIKLQNNGKDCIEVEDNGDGISKEDMLICTKRYATSKFIDLYNINTLGFRGEALYAIDNVSKLTIISNQHKYYNGIIEPFPTNNGTIIKVESLFYNIPVRRKFLNKKHINIDHFIESYVLAYPNIKFIVYSGTKKKIYNNHIQNIFEDVYNNRIDFNSKTADYEINGSIFVGLKHKYFIILNGRVLQDRQIMQCIRDAYSSISGYSSVSFVIFIKCNVNNYDVNIHPSKYEVQFNDNNIFAQIEKSVKEACNYWHVLYEDNKINNYKFQDTFILNEELQDEIQDCFSISNKYIVYQYKYKMIIIDQHAAHERILTHKLKANILEKQQLLQEIRYRLLPEQLYIWNDKSSLITTLFEYRLNSNIIIIHSISTIFNISDVFEILRNIYNLQQLEEYVNHILHEKGCKNAIKAGNILTKQEQLKLLHDLFNTPNYTFCNHGRPTIVVFNNKYLDNIFKRT